MNDLRKFILLHSPFVNRTKFPLPLGLPFRNADGEWWEIRYVQSSERMTYLCRIEDGSKQDVFTHEWVRDCLKSG